jgi:hypothetical protein
VSGVLEKDGEKIRHTYADYLTWDTGEQRYEIIDGDAHMMSSPTVSHQTISGGLFVQFLDTGEGPGHYISTAYDAAETIDVSVLPGLKIDWKAGYIPRSLLRKIYCHRKCCNPIFGSGHVPGPYNKFPIQRRYPGACSWVLHFTGIWRAP